MSFRLPITAASYFARRGGRSPPPPGFTACLCPLNVFEIVNPSVRICPWREGPVDGLRAARTRMIAENPFLIALQKPILDIGHAPLIQDCPSTSLSVWSCTKGRAALYLLVDVRSCWWRRHSPAGRLHKSGSVERQKALSHQNRIVNPAEGCATWATLSKVRLAKSKSGDLNTNPRYSSFKATWRDRS